MHIAEAGQGNEGRDAKPAKVEKIEGCAVFRVCHCLWNAQPAQPVVLPQHLAEVMLVRCRSRRGDRRRYHLASLASDGDVCLVGEMTTKLGPVDQRGVRVGLALE